MEELTVQAYRRETVRRVVRPLFRARRPGSRWLFPVGCYNSGTTITQAIIAAHPEVRTLPREGVRFTSVLPQPEDLGWTRMWVRCREYMEMPALREPEKSARVVADWSPWWGAPGGEAFMDKSITNGTRMPWLDLNFENSYFLGIIRNGYCAAEGIRRKARPQGAPAREVGESYPVRMVGEQWVAANERMLEDAKAVSRFEAIRYEDLVRDPVGVLNVVWDFFGLDRPPMGWDGETLEVAGARFAVRDMNPGSLARLSPEDVAELNTVIGSLQERLGYESLVPVTGAQ